MQNQYKPLLKKLIKHSLRGMVVQCLVVAPIFALDVTNETTPRENFFKTSLPQQTIVTGTVTSSEEGFPALPGVNVIVKGTTQGTTTDADGKYSLQIPDANAVLVFSFIGYTTQEIPASGRAVINLSMSADVQQLGEVVVVAYGEQLWRAKESNVNRSCFCRQQQRDRYHQE
jgi:hypothetical protein